jgi:hypothetical protein
VDTVTTTLKIHSPVKSRFQFLVPQVFMHVRVTFNSTTGYKCKPIYRVIFLLNSDHSPLGPFQVEVSSAVLTVIPFYHELV